MLDECAQALRECARWQDYDGGPRRLRDKTVRPLIARLEAALKGDPKR